MDLRHMVSRRRGGGKTSVAVFGLYKKVQCSSFPNAQCKRGRSSTELEERLFWLLHFYL